jgi:alpha-N-acetylglucosamine transferase
MKKNGYVMVWVVAVLAVVALVVLSYANNVSTNYKIIQSIYRTNSATHKAYGGVEYMKSYINSNELYFIDILNDELISSQNLYPSGVLQNEILLNQYNIENIDMTKESETQAFIDIEASHDVAKSNIRLRISYIDDKIEVLSVKVTN